MSVKKSKNPKYQKEKKKTHGFLFPSTDGSVRSSETFLPGISIQKFMSVEQKEKTKNTNKICIHILYQG